MAAGPQDRGKHTCTHLISCERWLLIATILLKLFLVAEIQNISTSNTLSLSCGKTTKAQTENYGEDDRDEDCFCVFVFSVCRL